MNDGWIERTAYALAGVILGLLLVAAVSFFMMMPLVVWVAVPVGCGLVGANFGHNALEMLKRVVEEIV